MSFTRVGPKHAIWSMKSDKFGNINKTFNFDAYLKIDQCYLHTAKISHHENHTNILNLDSEGHMHILYIGSTNYSGNNDAFTGFTI